MLKQTNPEDLSRRERQIMSVLFERGQATAQEIREALADPPSYSAVRGLLRVMETKGQIQHQAEGVKYVYRPIEARQTVARTAMRHVIKTFFGGSLERAVTTLLTERDLDVSNEELDRLAALIEKAKKEGEDHE